MGLMNSGFKLRFYSLWYSAFDQKKPKGFGKKPRKNRVFCFRNILFGDHRQRLQPCPGLLDKAFMSKYIFFV